MDGVEGLVFFDEGRQSPLYRNLYWTTDVVLYFLLFLMVITMIYKVMEASPLRTKIGPMLAFIVAVVVLAPFLILKDPYFSTRWFGHTSQMLSFGAAGMNLFLWTAAIGRRKRDPQLLVVSAGLGIAVTGAAIAYGVRFFLPVADRLLPDLFMIGTHLLSMAIWCWAFRPAVSEPSASINAVPDPS
jgi:hypothetical protein